MATTTNYGFEIPDDTDLVKDGALAMRDLGQDVDTQLFTALGGNYPGLRLIKKQTIGSAVSSVTVTGAFSATYENYLVQVVGSNGSSSGNELRMTINGSAGSTYNSAGNAVTYLASNAFAGNSSAAYWIIGTTGTNSTTNANVQVFQPFQTARSGFSSQYFTNANAGTYGGFDNNAASSTALTVTVGVTLTGGTIYVYGYGAS
jgi:hypothetical protein